MEFTIDKLPQGVPLKAVGISVPEWGDPMTAYVAELTADERDQRIETFWRNRRAENEQEDNVGLRAFTVAAALCDHDRKFLADDEKAVNELADKLSQQSAVPISRLCNAVCALNHLLQEDMEELEKN